MKTMFALVGLLLFQLNFGASPVDTPGVSAVAGMGTSGADQAARMDTFGGDPVAPMDTLPLEAAGLALNHFFTDMGVEHLWIAGAHINWETGVPDDPRARHEIHTHCSAFVAAACERLGIYILRPPEHPQQLLSNAQYDWLHSNAALKEGWQPLPGDTDRIQVYLHAQQLANSGFVVCAVCKNPDQSDPGHIALVNPRKIDAQRIQDNGPVMIMAGTHNFNYIALRNAFRSHITGWPEKEISFFYWKEAPRIP